MLLWNCYDVRSVTIKENRCINKSWQFFLILLKANDQGHFRIISQSESWSPSFLVKMRFHSWLEILFAASLLTPPPSFLCRAFPSLTPQFSLLVLFKTGSQVKMSATFLGRDCKIFLQSFLLLYKNPQQYTFCPVRENGTFWLYAI